MLEGKPDRVTVEFDSPGALLKHLGRGWARAPGRRVPVRGQPAGLVMLVGEVGAASGLCPEHRVIDAKSRTIWREAGPRVEALLPFERCRALRIFRERTLQDGRDNSKFTIEVQDSERGWFILGDHVSHQDALAIGTLLALVPQETP